MPHHLSTPIHLWCVVVLLYIRTCSPSQLVYLRLAVSQLRISKQLYSAVQWHVSSTEVKFKARFKSHPQLCAPMYLSLRDIFSVTVCPCLLFCDVGKLYWKSLGESALLVLQIVFWWWRISRRLSPGDCKNLIFYFKFSSPRTRTTIALQNVSAGLEQQPPRSMSTLSADN